MPSETDETTIVGKWLKALGAAKYTKVFFDRGYKELEEVTKDVIERLVEDKPLAAKLVASATALNDLRPGPNPQPIGGSGSVGIPPLPPGTTLDLTHPTIQLPGVAEFKIPDLLSVPSSHSAVINPHSLTTGDWIVIARNNNLLRAYTLDDPPGGRGDPPRAKELALDYMVPESAAFLEDKHLISEVRQEITYSAATASYVRAGFDKQSASLSIPYVAASFERQHKDKEAQASSRKTIYMFGSWYYPRALLHLKKFTKASTRLTVAIEAALNANDADALKQVFDKYGWAAPEDVEIGGQLFLEHREECGASVNETEVENTISAAVTAKYNNAAAEVGVGFGNASGTKVTAEQLNKSTSFRAKGGVATLASNPQQWPDSVNNPNNWGVIGVSNLAPITDWLEPALRARVERLLPEMRMPAIGELQDTDAGDHYGRAERTQFVLGSRRVPDQQDGARGAVHLVCGTSMTPELGRGDAVGGAASFHRYRDGNGWIDTSSVCLPVPAGHHYATSTSDTWFYNGRAPVRFAVAETNLTLDKWHLIEAPPTMHNYRGFTAPTDGFVFCSVEAKNDGDRGYVTCQVDKILIAAASVHNHSDHNDLIRYASFCAPFAKGSVVEVRATPTNGQVWFSAWQIPSTSQTWKFTKPEKLTVRARDGFDWVTAETDGFLNGVVTVSDDGPRGILRLDCTRDQNSFLSHPGSVGHPLASAAVHVYHYRNTDKNISHASAMLPVRKGYLMSANFTPTSGAPQAEAYWTEVVPIM